MSRLRGRTRGSVTGLTVSVVALAALTGLTACTSSGSAASPQSSAATATATAQAGSTQAASGSILPSHSTLHWHSCSGQLAEEGVPDCTMLSVPLNYADPGGRHISLALDMIPATAPTGQQQGIMLVNPGGPGGSGLSLAPGVAQGLRSTVAAD